MTEKEEITARIIDLIKRKGVHAVQMNTLSRDALIPRDYLRKYFNNKEEVFLACVKKLINDHYKATRAIAISKLNPLLKVARIYEMSLNGILDFHLSFFFYLQKKYRPLYHLFEEYRAQLYDKVVGTLLYQAKKEGYLLKEVDVTLFCQIQLSRSRLLLENMDFSFNKEEKKLVQHLIWTSLRGIVKKEHIALLD
jgi:AcrR family transcriptional regulator